MKKEKQRIAEIDRSRDRDSEIKNNEIEMKKESQSDDTKTSDSRSEEDQQKIYTISSLNIESQGVCNNLGNPSNIDNFHPNTNNRFSPDKLNSDASRSLIQQLRIGYGDKNSRILYRPVSTMGRNKYGEYLSKDDSFTIDKLSNPDINNSNKPKITLRDLESRINRVTVDDKIKNNPAINTTRLPHDFRNDEAATIIGLMKFKNYEIYRPKTTFFKYKRSVLYSNFLNTIFEINKYPSSEMRDNIAYLISASARNVQVWFQNRRQKLRDNIKATDKKGKKLTKAETINQTKNYNEYENDDKRNKDNRYGDAINDSDDEYTHDDSQDMFKNSLDDLDLLLLYEQEIRKLSKKTTGKR